MLELQIAQLLQMGQSHESIGQSLVEGATTGAADAEKIRTIGYFLFHTGQYPLLFALIEKLSQQNKILPWGAMVLSLTALTENIPSGYMQTILEGATEQDELAQILPIKILEKFSPEFTDERKKYLAHVRDIYETNKKSILDKISYLKSQRVIEEEGKAINDFKALFPSDKSIATLEADFEKRKAEYMISRLDVPAKVKSKRLKAPPVPHELQPWITELVKAARSFAKSNPQSAIDLSLMFYFCELYKEALAVISVEPETKMGNWLQLELKILSGRYVDAMEEARRLEQLYAADPEATFATVYSRAQCLWELGQHQLAITLLQEIVNVRPHFRSAHSLLKEWTDELT